MAIEELRRVRYFRSYQFEGFADEDTPKTIRPRRLRRAASWLLDHGYYPSGGHYEYGSEEGNEAGFTVSRLAQDLDARNFRYPESPQLDTLLGPYVIDGADDVLHIRIGEAAVSRWIRPVEILDVEIDPEGDQLAA